MTYNLIIPEYAEKYFRIEMKEGRKVIRTLFFETDSFEFLDGIELKNNPLYVYDCSEMSLHERLDEGAILFDTETVKAVVSNIKKLNINHFTK